MVIMGYGHPKRQVKADAVPTRFPNEQLIMKSYWKEKEFVW